MKIDDKLNTAILAFVFKRDVSGVPIASVPEAMESVRDLCDDDTFYLHLHHLREAGYIRLHGIGRIDISDRGYPTVHGDVRNAGYRLTAKGEYYWSKHLQNIEAKC